jgi:hypothetical protein
LTPSVPDEREAQHDETAGADRRYGRAAHAAGGAGPSGRDRAAREGTNLSQREVWQQMGQCEMINHFGDDNGTAQFGSEEGVERDMAKDVKKWDAHHNYADGTHSSAGYVKHNMPRSSDARDEYLNGRGTSEADWSS